MDVQRSSLSDDKTQGLTDASAVESKGEGAVDSDAALLELMGYKPQLRREFNVIQLVSAGFVATASWLGIVGTFSYGVMMGGSASIVYGLIIVAIFNLFIVTSLAEMVSAMPTSGGQYVWALQLAPPKIARVSAFGTGICNLAAGITAGASSCVLAGHWIMGVVVLIHPEFEPQTYQMWFLGVAFYVGCGIIGFSQKLIAKSVFVGFIFSLLVYAVILIVPPSLTPAHASASTIFTSTENISGWSSYAGAFLVSLINSSYCYGLIDTAVHLAEEVPNPQINVPKALFTTVIVGFITSWPLGITLLYCMSDFEAVVGTPTGVPLLQLFYMALRGNKAGASALLMLILTCGVFAMVGLQAYQARICWAFSRDNGLPFSNYLSGVNTKLGVPLRAHLFCLTIAVILSLLALASSTAFNSLAGALIVFPALSYILPIIFSLLPANRHIKGPFNLGVFGVIAKVLTIFFSILITILYCFPFFMPVTGSSMNYLSVIIVVVGIYGALDWVIRARKTFKFQEEHRPAH